MSTATDPAVAAGLESGDGGVGAHSMPMPSMARWRPLAHVRVERGHRLRGLIHDGDGDSPRAPSPRPSPRRCSPRRPPRPGAAGARVQIRQQRGPVVESLHAEHAGGVHAGQRRPHRDRAGRDDQGVEALPGRPPGGQVMSDDPAGREVDLLHLGSHPQVDAVAPVLRPANGPPVAPARPHRRPPSTGCRRPRRSVYAPRSNATISTASPAIRLACEAALIPAASAPITTIRSVMPPRWWYGSRFPPGPPW